MNNNLTDITIILDRSGSMSSIRTDTIGGFNTFLTEQQAEPGEAVLSLVQFDNKYEVNYTAVNITDVKPLDETTYCPRGMTALNDAIGKTINETGERLRKIEESQRPGKVVVVIITDGFENTSREFQKTQIKEMIQHQESKYNWEFIFLGANMDAVSEGASYGTLSDKSMTWEANSEAVSNTYGALSNKMSAYRGGAKFGFDATDRASASVK